MPVVFEDDLVFLAASRAGTSACSNTLLNSGQEERLCWGTSSLFLKSCYSYNYKSKAWGKGGIVFCSYQTT